MSLQTRQSGSGGSRGNATRASASVHKSTPVPARHLSFPQSSPDSLTQPRASPHDFPSPNLSLPTLKPPRAVSHSPQVTRSAPGSQDRAVLSDPENIQAAPASPTLSLPSPRASKAAPSSPALESQSQLQDPVHISSASVDDGQGAAAAAAAAATAGLCNPDATRQEQQEETEVHILSEIWKVFEQVIKQVNCYSDGNVAFSAHDL